MVELKRFFKDYKKLEHKDLVVEQFFGREEAYRFVRESMVRYPRVVESGERDEVLR